MLKPNTLVLFAYFVVVIVCSSLSISNGDRSSSCPPLVGVNHNPVIGILSHPTHNNKKSYISSSYVKFVEAAGARAIPLLYDEPWTHLSAKLDSVNGVLLTGGTRQYGPYFDVIKKIFQKVKEKNDAGEHFPLYAINLGFELLVKIVGEDDDILESVAAQKYTTTLECEDVDITKTVMGSYPEDLRNKLMKDCLISLNNKFGISRERFLSNEKLSSFFLAITTCNDTNNKVFVTTMQAYDYPIVGFQWNPQKNAFDWSSPEIPHSSDAIQVTQYAANYLVSEARKSHESLNELVLGNLINRYNTKYSEASGTETYYFDAYGSLASGVAFSDE